MRRLLKYLAIFVLLILVGAGLLIALLPTKQIVEIAAEQVRNATGRDLIVTGDVSPSFYPVLGVEAEGVTLSNADWAEGDNMIAADAVKVGVELFPMISGDIRVTEIRLEKPQVLLEIDENGVGNWVFADAAAPADAAGGEGGGLPQKLSLGETSIAGGSVRFIDRRSGQTIMVEEIDARVGLTALSAPLRIDGAALWNGRKAEIELALSTIESLMAGGETQLELELESDVAKLSFNGAFAPPSGGAAPEASGKYSLAVANPAEAARWAAGMDVAGLEGLSDVKLEGSVGVDSSALGVTAVGGLTRDGKRLLLDVEASGGADWRDRRAFDLVAEAALEGALTLRYSGKAAAPEGGEPSLDGRLSVSGAKPGAAVAWATGAAAPELDALSDLSVEGDVSMGPKGARVDLSGGVSRERRRLDAALKASGGPDWMTARAFDVTLDARSEGLGAVSYKGAVSAPAQGQPAADGQISANIPDLRAFAAFAGVALPEGNEKAFRRFALDGAVATPEPGVIRLRAGALDFDAIKARGEVVLAMGEPMRVTADLSTGPLNLDPYLTDDAQAPQGAGWSREPIDLSALGALNGDIAIRAESVKARKVELGVSDLTARLRNGKLDLKIRELGLYGGGVKGDITVDGRDGNAMQAAITAKSIQLRPLLKAFADIDMISGLGALEMNVTSRGESIHDIMNALNGDGAMLLKDGALEGVNLAAMVRNVKSAFTGVGGGDRKTDFSEVSGTFRIKQGVLNNADFKFLGPLIRIVGEGDVNLGGQAMKFRLTPKAVSTLKGQGGDLAASGLAFPLLISGPWSDLSIRPDLDAGITGLLKDPEGALGAAKALTEGGVGGLKDAAGGAAKEALGAAAGGAGALTTILGGGGGGDGRDIQAEIDAAKAEVDDAKAAGDKKRLRAARERLQALREEKKEANSSDGGGAEAAVGKVLKGLTGN